MLRFVKAFLFGITGLFVIITLFSLLIPSRVRVSRVVEINTTNAKNIYQQVANFKNWKNWHPAFLSDTLPLNNALNAPAAKDSNDYTIDQRGKAIRLVLQSADTSSICFLMQANGERDIQNNIAIIAVPDQQSVQVEWSALHSLRWYPWEKFYGIFVDKLTGDSYEIALKGLKEFIETHP